MIEVRINGYECDPGEIEIGTAGSYGVQQLHFAFSSEWEGLTRRTTWMTDAGKIAVLLDESDTMTVPAEATATAGRRWLSVDGVSAGKQMISVRMGYKVYETVEPGGENSVTPTDEEMTQALAILEEVKALKTPEITVGKTETVEAGTPARVENTGTATKAVLDFEIPRGESGVYVGAAEPDETVKVWVDPEGENDAEGAVIDLNAAVQEAREAAEEAGRAVESAASAKESAASAKESADAAKTSASGAGGSLTHSVSAMKRAAAYAEGGTAPAALIGNVSYPEIDTIGAKGYMEQAKAASESAGSEKDAVEAARTAAEAAESGAIAAKTAAEAAVLNGPKIENDTWWVYDAAKQTYVDTGVDASGLAGQQGERGTGLLKVSTAPSSYTTAIGDYTPKYRIALDTVIAESGADKVLVGDVIEQSYYHYVVDYLDETYAYSSVTRTSIRGATGATGAQGVGVRDVLPVAESSESGGTNTFRVRLTDGNYTDFNYRNGKDGGYYEPDVTQPSENMMRLTYFPSQEGMGDIKVKNIVLPQGIPGSDGKTAYQYAQDGGYTGTETEFAAKLAAEHLPVPAAAAVGQYFKVKTVDETGLVTEVEAVDMADAENEWIQIASGDVGDGVVAFEFTGLESYKELLFTGEWDKGEKSSGALLYLNGTACFPAQNNSYFVHQHQAKQIGIHMQYLTGRRVKFDRGSTCLNNQFNQDFYGTIIITLPTSVTGNRADTLKIQLSTSDAVIPTGGKYALYGRT